MAERLRQIEAPIDKALRKIIATYPHSQKNIEIQRAIIALMIETGEMPTSFEDTDYLIMTSRLSEKTSAYLSSVPHTKVTQNAIKEDAGEVIGVLATVVKRANNNPPTPDEIASHKIRALNLIIKADTRYQSWFFTDRRPRRPFKGGDTLWKDPSFSFIVKYGIEKKPTGSAAIDSVYAHLPIYALNPDRNKLLQGLLNKYNKRHPHSPVSFDPKDFSANLG